MDFYDTLIFEVVLYICSTLIFLWYINDLIPINKSHNRIRHSTRSISLVTFRKRPTHLKSVFNEREEPPIKLINSLRIIRGSFCKLCRIKFKISFYFFPSLALGMITRTDLNSSLSNKTKSGVSILKVQVRISFFFKNTHTTHKSEYMIIYVIKI